MKVQRNHLGHVGLNHNDAGKAKRNRIRVHSAKICIRSSGFHDGICVSFKDDAGNITDLQSVSHTAALNDIQTHCSLFELNPTQTVLLPEILTEASQTHQENKLNNYIIFLVDNRLFYCGEALELVSPHSSTPPLKITTTYGCLTFLSTTRI